MSTRDAELRPELLTKQRAHAPLTHDALRAREFPRALFNWLRRREMTSAERPNYTFTKKKKHGGAKQTTVLFDTRASVAMDTSVASLLLRPKQTSRVLAAS